MNINEYNIFIRHKNHEIIKDFLVKEILNFDETRVKDFLYIARDFSLFQLHEFDSEIEKSIEILILSKRYKDVVDIFCDTKCNKTYIDIYVMKALYRIGEIEKSNHLQEKIFERIKKEKTWNLCPLYFKELEEIVDSRELLISKIEYFKEISMYEDLERYLISKIDLKASDQKLDLALEVVRKASNYLYEKMSLYRKVKNTIIESDEKIKALILFLDREISFLAENKKLKVKIDTGEKEDVLALSSEVVKVEHEKSVTPKLTYIKSKEEEKLIRRLKNNDPIFENYNRDLALSFINFEMYELLILYVGNFDETLDRLYLKLEALLRIGKFSHVVDEINSKVKNESIAFRYLKALAYKEMGFDKKAKSEFKEIASKDNRFRKVREFLDES